MEVELPQEIEEVVEQSKVVVVEEEEKRTDKYEENGNEKDVDEKNNGEKEKGKEKEKETEKEKDEKVVVEKEEEEGTFPLVHLLPSLWSRVVEALRSPLNDHKDLKALPLLLLFHFPLLLQFPPPPNLFSRHLLLFAVGFPCFLSSSVSPSSSFSLSSMISSSLFHILLEPRFHSPSPSFPLLLLLLLGGIRLSFPFPISSYYPLLLLASDISDLREGSSRPRLLPRRPRCRLLRLWSSSFSTPHFLLLFLFRPLPPSPPSLCFSFLLRFSVLMIEIPLQFRHPV